MTMSNGDEQVEGPVRAAAPGAHDPDAERSEVAGEPGRPVRAAVRPSSLPDLLTGYEEEVRAAIRQTMEAETGTERVRALHNLLSPSVVVHDAVLESALCPVLDDLPGGSPLADRLRQGCRERGELLRRFERLSKGVAAPNVYPASGEEVEEILEGLHHSFEAHAHDETTSVGDVLASAVASTDLTAVVARMAMAARSAPTRFHAPSSAPGGSSLLNRLHRDRDRVADWVDTHHGWLDPRAARRSPRNAQVETLEGEAEGSIPTVSVREMLAGYDATIVETITELRDARDEGAKAEAAHRLNAAITVHDSVLGGVLCPLLDSVPGGEEAGARLREGCLERARLQEAWDALVRRVPKEELFEDHGPEVDEIIEPLIASFVRHQQTGTPEVADILEGLPAEAYRTKASPFWDFSWPWHSEGPDILALRMALWARSSPTRVHPLFVKHPASRTLRSWFHLTDHFRDFWGDTALDRWVVPKMPTRPLSTRSRRRVVQRG